MSNMHISAVPEFKASPVALAFTTYVLATTIGMPYSATQVTPCDIKFGNLAIRYRIYLEGDGNQVAEFFIVMDGDRLDCMIQRRFDGETLLEDCLGITHYEHRKFQAAHMLADIKALPKQSRVEYHGCSCGTKH